MAKVQILLAIAACFLFYYVEEWTQSSTGVAAYTPPSCDCACPAYSGCPGGQPPYSYPLKDCTAQCDVAKQGDCYCNKDFHPTGCTLKPCTAQDSDEVGNYTCYCTPTFAPSDCIAPSNPSKPRCDPSLNGETVPTDTCTCDTENADPDNCNIRVCDPNEETGSGYRCVCGESCDRYSRGCIKEPAK